MRFICCLFAWYANRLQIGKRALFRIYSQSLGVGLGVGGVGLRKMNISLIKPEDSAYPAAPRRFFPVAIATDTLAG